MKQGLLMREPQSIAVNEDERLIPIWSIVVAAAAFVLVEYYFWLVLPEGRNHQPHLFQSFLGIAGCALFSDGGLCEQGCAAAGDEFAVLDCDLLRDAGGHWRGALLPAAGADGFALPCLLNACAERLSLLPAVRLPADGQLRELLQNRTRHGPVLHAMRA